MYSSQQTWKFSISNCMWHTAALSMFPSSMTWFKKKKILICFIWKAKTELEKAPAWLECICLPRMLSSQKWDGSSHQDYRGTPSHSATPSSHLALQQPLQCLDPCWNWTDTFHNNLKFIQRYLLYNLLNFVKYRIA